MKILAINPGSTSTKIAVYNNQTELLNRNIHHSERDLSNFKSIAEQYAFRRDLILQTLQNEQIELHFDAIIGRGGILRAIESGVYEVNELMKQDLKHSKTEHASNLGGLIAAELALLAHCKAYIADPVVVDELDDLCRITGTPLLPRRSLCHALNHKATARKYAKEIGKPYESLNLLIAHLGGGISIGAHRKGRMVDINNGLDGEGPFSPERAGTLPAGQLVDLCFSGHYTQQEIKKIIAGQGGLYAHVGSKDAELIVKKAIEGDSKSIFILDALIYGIAKQVAATSIAFNGTPDAIILTGGLAHSDYLISRLSTQIRFIAPITVYPGEDELHALASNALSVLTGELSCKIY